MLNKNIKNILLLEPVNTPLDVLTKSQQNLKNNKKRALLVYVAGLVLRKARVRLSTLHSIPLGLAQLSSIVKEEGISTSHVPFILESTKRHVPNEEIEKKVRSHDYDTVWMTVGSPEAALETFRYAKIIKEINEDTPVMIGGVFPSMFPEFFLKNPEIDYLIRGPAEVAARQYVRNPTLENYKNIQGFCYRNGSGESNISPFHARMPDMNTIPPYDLEGLCIDEYMKDNHYCNLQASRGCPFKCPFCSHTRFWGAVPKFRPINNLRKELRVLNDHDCKAGYMVDSTFTINKNYMRKFVEAYEEEEISIKLWFETRADLFTQEIADLATRMNTCLIWFGAESGSPEILKRLNGKNHDEGRQHVKNLLNAVQIAKRSNLLCGSSWVIGLPGENKKSIQETKDVIFNLTKAGMDVCDVRILQVFPGTPYWENPRKWGLKLIEKEMGAHDSPWDKYAGHETEEMTSDEIVMAANQIKDDLFDYYLLQTQFNRKKRKIQA